jgi:hypothetical protein
MKLQILLYLPEDDHMIGRNYELIKICLRTFVGTVITHIRLVHEICIT